MPEATDQDSEANKSGYKKISDITIERNRRVVEKLNTARQEKAATLFDVERPPLPALGFKVYKLRKSNFPRTEWTPDPAKSEEDNLATLQEYIRLKESQLVTMFNKRELMTEIMLKQGFTLHFMAQVLPEFGKNEVYLITEQMSEPAQPKKGKAAPVAEPKQVLLCLDGRLENETLEYLRTHNERKFICLERALDTTKKWNLKHYLGDNFFAF
jgi:adenine-specific DNA-methyltransferase